MDKKKLAAIMSAVTSYIESEEAAAYQRAAYPQHMQAGQGIITHVITEKAPPANLWGTHGRQSQMQMRTLMQARAFYR